MRPEVSQFLSKATVAALKEKLASLGCQTSGNKAELILRVEEVVKKMSNDEIEQHFADDVLDPSAGSSSTSNGDDNDSEDAEDAGLDKELETLREKLKKKKEILELKKQLAELNNEIPSSSSFFSFKDVEESLHAFSGDDKHDIKKWIQQIEDAAEVLGWSEKACFIYSRRLLTGTAKLYLRTISVKSWNDLKRKLIQEFDNKISSAEIHNELRRRKRKNGETWQQYIFSMQEIASAADVDEADLIQYIIDGVNDSYANKMMLYNANTLHDLKQAFKKYDKIKKHQTDNPIDRRKVDLSKIKQKPQTRCYNCNNVGHSIYNCPHPRRPKGSCYRCGKVGHKLQECSEKPIHSVDKTRSSASSQEQHNENEFEFNIKYAFKDDDHPVKFECILLTLLDSGSPISFIQEKFLPSSVIRPLCQDKYNFCGLNGSALHIIGVTNLEINFDNVINLEIYVVKNNSMSYPIILGRNFIKKSNLKFSNEMRNKRNEYQQKENEIMLQDETPCAENESNGELVEERKDSCTFYNTNLENKNYLEEILCIDVSNDEPENNFNINNNLPFDVRQQVENVLRSACFRSNKDESVRPKIDYEMEIKVMDEKPFYCTPRRLPYAHKLELEKILNDLLKRGIIRESNSPYSSPIVLVQKKNKELRLCVDYRALNKVTVRDNFPLPLIEDHLDQLRDKRYFSVLDLKNGFHHVKIAENSIKYTSFITPLCQFEYLRMPFGLKNAPAVFEKYMKKVFKPLISTGKVLSYIDDILIATETVEEHLVILKQVIDIVVENCLQLRYDKCSFLNQEIIYLGYKINYNGIQPNEYNLKAIRQFPIPSCVKTVQSFLGLCSYFRKFIENFAILAKPLYDLLRKENKFVFGEKELKAYEILKSKLLESPVLSIYCPKNETQLHCDASSLGYGAVLLQKQKDGKFHPVAYFSKRVSETEKKYHSYELETLSIIYALRRFHVYLIGLKFKIVTDCQSLALTLNKKCINPRISRWALELQNYDFTIEHRKGDKMLHADALSRSINVI